RPRREPLRAAQPSVELVRGPVARHLEQRRRIAVAAAAMRDAPADHAMQRRPVAVPGAVADGVAGRTLPEQQCAGGGIGAG
nr:hypothetical protein [Tanacetum cinerariifolium]